MQVDHLPCMYATLQYNNWFLGMAQRLTRIFDAGAFRLRLLGFGLAPPDCPNRIKLNIVWIVNDCNAEFRD